MSVRSDRLTEAVENLEHALREGWPPGDPQVEALLNQACPALRMWAMTEGQKDEQRELNRKLETTVIPLTESTPDSKAPERMAEHDGTGGI